MDSRRKRICIWNSGANRGFTLIELLVVVAVFAILVALLFPVIAQARREPQVINCISNLRQVGQAFQMYRDDYELRPPYLHSLSPNYIRSPQLLTCSQDEWLKEGGWAWSAWGQNSLPKTTWPLPVSYGYFLSPFVHSDEWEELAKQPGKPGYVVCVLHGKRAGESYVHNAAPHFKGKVVRLFLDGSVGVRHVDYSERFNRMRLMAD